VNDSHDKLAVKLEKVRQSLIEGNFSEAQAMANAVRRKLEGTDPSLIHARTLMLCGITYQYRGEMWSSEHYLEKAALMYEEIDQVGDALLCNSYRARCISEYGDIQRAHHIAEQSLARARKIELRDMEARLLSSLGIICLKMNRVAEAGDFTIQAIDIFRELGDHYNVKHSTLQLANFYAVSRRVADSQRILEQGIADAQEKGDGAYESWLQMNLGSIYYRQNNFTAARECYRRAIKLAGTDGVAAVKAHARQGWGLVELRAGNRDKARNQLLRSMHLASAASIFLVENLSLIYQGVLDLYDLNDTDALSKFDLVQHRVISYCHLEKGLVNYYQSIGLLLSGNLQLADRLFEERLPVRNAGEYLDDVQITADLLDYLLEANGRGDADFSSEQLECLLKWRGIIKGELTSPPSMESAGAC